MEKIEYNDLITDIKDIKRTDWQAYLVILRKGIDTFFNSLLSFGINDTTIDTVKMLKEYYESFITSNHLYNFIIKQGMIMDSEEVYKFLNKIIDINNNTLSYFVDALLEVKVGTLNFNSIQTKRPYRSFKLLNEINTYMLEAIGLTLTFSDIINYFNYPNDFWPYIEPNITILDSHNPDTSSFYLVNIKCDEHNRLSKFRVNVPAIVNLHTAKVNIHEFRHAYDLYQYLGKEISIPDQVFEDNARQEEQAFVNEYVKRKVISKIIK